MKSANINIMFIWEFHFEISNLLFAQHYEKWGFSAYSIFCLMLWMSKKCSMFPHTQNIYENYDEALNFLI